MVNDEVAAALLDAAAVQSGVTGLARALLAAGPLSAKDCRQVVVWSNGIRQQNSPTDANLTVGLYGGCCAGVSVQSYTVRFLADCYPAFDDQGAPAPVDTVTAWTAAFMADTERINAALLGTDLSGLPSAPFTYDCSNLLVGDAVVAGPDGGAAWVDWQVQFSPA